MKTHIVTLGFDDGYRKSSYLTAEIFERHGLRAQLNVVADRSLAGPSKDFPFGSFDDWNVIQSRGHDIEPHTWNHANYLEMPLTEVIEHLHLCNDCFKKNLRDYEPAKSTFNHAFNASNPEIDREVLAIYGAVRTEGPAVCPIPRKGEKPITGCAAFGPTNSDEAFDRYLTEFINSAGGWFVWCAHGLEDEGYGPLSPEALDHQLARLTALDHVAVLTTRQVLDRRGP